MITHEADEHVLEAHQLLIQRGVIEPLADDDLDVSRWLSWELASLVEGHFHYEVDFDHAGAAVRRKWERRLAHAGDRLRDPRSDKFRRVYWLLLDGERVGTIGIASLRLARSDVEISSLYVLPAFRGREIATRAVAAVYDAVVASGADGLRLETSWCWHRAVRFYLRLGFWLGNWKHALQFVRSKQLCPYRVDVADTYARFAVRPEAAWSTWIEANHAGSLLGWNELATSSSEDSLRALRHIATSTFALHLAVQRWPLIRSPELWERRFDWCDLGMPEGLAYKIAVFEAVA